MNKLFKKFFPENFKRNVKEELGVPLLHWSLMNMKRLGFYPKITIDIGAYHGEWTKSFLEVFPKSKVLMLDAQSGKKQILKQVCNQHSNVNYEIALLSSKTEKEVVFVENETGSAISASADLEDTRGKKIKTSSLDCLLEKLQHPYPNFLKLDVQGHELEVLKGGENSLANSEVCLLEVSFLDLGFQHPLFQEVVNFMNNREFQVYDIVGLIRRPYDKALYQADVLFVKKSSQLLASKNW